MAGAVEVETAPLGPLAVLAGGGDFPAAVARAAMAEGRGVIVAAIRGEADASIAAFPHRWVGRGQLGTVLRLFRDAGARDLVIVGGMRERRLPRLDELDLGAILVFQNMRASRNAPLAYDLYPDAAKVNETTQKSADTVLYSTEAPVDQVFAFYKARMGADPLEGCQLFFTTEPPSNDPGKSFARCVLDRSQDDMTQTLKITITYDEAVQRTLIQYERQWGNQ